MRENYIQAGSKGSDSRIHIDGDWYGHGIPSNVRLAHNVYIDTSYGFAAFHSTQPDALFIDEASGCYDRASFIVGEAGKISVGKYCILNGSTIICKKRITIGDHCMMAWGSVLTDSWMDASLFPIEARRMLLKKTAEDPMRRYPFFGEASPIILEDNCWVGFDSVILPGVTLGRGCVVGCKTVISEDVPPYAVVTGSPARIVKYLAPNDTEEEKVKALKLYSK
jgi:acetyltransferase-like isoleucine patch superfamily enzyme